MKNWNEKHIKQLHQAGKIRGYKCSAPRNKKRGKRASRIPQPRAKALVWLDWNIQYWCNERSLSMVPEFKFDQSRNWRFDYAIPAHKIAVEFEGGVFMEKSGHNTAKHYTKDTEKYNRAAVLAWRVIRVTALNYKTALQQLNELIK